MRANHPPKELGMHNDRNRLLERLNYPNVRRWSAVKLAGVGARSYLEKLQFLRLYKGGKHRFLSFRLVQRVMVQTQVALEALYKKHKSMKVVTNSDLTRHAARQHTPSQPRRRLQGVPLGRVYYTAPGHFTILWRQSWRSAYLRTAAPISPMENTWVTEHRAAAQQVPFSGAYSVGCPDTGGPGHFC
jgi:hypothetical protein